MRVRLAGFSLLLTFWATSLAFAADSPPYYLALGDSLSLGVQPTSRGLAATNQGYADDLHAFYRLRVPGLQLAKLGCSGETTSTMITGGVCAYPLRNQLAQAAHFLRTHRVALVTLDIGADNIVHCISLSGIDQTCLANGINAAILVDLPQILATLRAAAPDVPIVAMNYYDPFLAAYRLVPAPTGPALALASLQVTTFFNEGLERVYRTFGVPVAQVAAAFRTTTFSTVPALNLPLNVALTLTWTWMALPPPLGPDIHPNAAGYAVIAGAFVKTIGGR